MNNKGFAITTVIYGTIILFMLLLVSILAMMSNYLKDLNLLIDSNNGVRNTATIKHICVTETNIDQIKARYFDPVKNKAYSLYQRQENCRKNFKSGLYCLGSSSTSSCSTNCVYIPRKRVCN